MGCFLARIPALGQVLEASNQTGLIEKWPQRRIVRHLHIGRHIKNGLPTRARHENDLGTTART
jgi:hypothetical protein